MFNKSIPIQKKKKTNGTSLAEISKTKVGKHSIEIKDIEHVLKSALPEFKREKISRSESCI